MTIRHISRLVIPDGIWYTADGICAGGGSRMCCRYYLEESPELRPIVEAMNRSPLAARFQEKGAPLFRGEIRPTDTAPVIATSRSGARAVFPMRWGFSGKSLLINAKTETAAAKPTFREAWTSHRCIVPASWYFEWEHLTAEDGKKRTGSKFMLHAKDAPVTWMCGLYRMEEGLPCFVILTREPGDEIRFIHDRMPLILHGSLTDAWINPESDPAEIAQKAQTDLLFERAI